MADQSGRTNTELMAEIHALRARVAELERGHGDRSGSEDGLPVDALIRATLEHSDHIIYIFDITEDRYVYLSSNIARITGFDADRYRLFHFADITEHVHPDDRAGYCAMFDRVSSSPMGHGGQRPSAIEYRRLTEDGGYRWFREYIARISSSEPEHVYVIGTAADISAQVATATVIHESKKQYADLSHQFRAILDAVPDVLLFQRPELKIIWANKAAADSLGTTPETMIGAQCHSLWHNSEVPCKGCPVQACFASRRPEVAEISSATGHNWEVRAIPVLSDASSMIGVIELARDITCRSAFEEERLQSVKLQSLGTLAGGIAHDFNNLLTGILGNIGLSKLYLDTKHDAYRMLTQAEQVASRAKRLTSQFITFSEGGAPMKKRTDMAPFIREQVAQAVTKSSIECRMSLADDLHACEIDEKQFEHVIRNLVTNALDAMKDSGVLTVTAQNVQVRDERPAPLPDGEYIRISVADDGHGISQKHLSRVFDPYFTTKDVGHGLGLAVSYSIVRKHGGHIAVSSPQGKGATFDIYLPVVVGTTETNQTDTAKHQGRILLMDDEEVIRMATGRLLVRHGYEVETAADGESAVALFRAAWESGTPFDVVILDLTVINGMGGNHALKSIRHIDPDIKAIVSSGYYNDPLMADYRKYGFQGKSEKPYLINDLTRLIRQVMHGDAGGIGE